MSEQPATPGAGVQGAAITLSTKPQYTCLKSVGPELRGCGLKFESWEALRAHEAQVHPTSKQNIGDIFARYAQHDQGCASRIPLSLPRGFNRGPCSCGMDAAIHQIVAVETTLRQVQTCAPETPALPSAEQTSDHELPGNFNLVVEMYQELKRGNAGLRAALETTQQALIEVNHAQECGASWYTRGAGGLYQQVQMWVRKGMKAAQEALSGDSSAPEKPRCICPRGVSRSDCPACGPTPAVETGVSERGAKLDELAKLPHGWDSYGGIPPRADCLEKARQLAALLPPGHWDIVPMSNGGIQIEQHCGGLDIELMIEGSRPSAEETSESRLISTAPHGEPGLTGSPPSSGKAPPAKVFADADNNGRDARVLVPPEKAAEEPEDSRGYDPETGCGIAAPPKF